MTTSDKVGICLSGGGVRAASFALGVVQGLQTERGLLFGKDSADLLVGVSGGAYTAATATLHARALNDETHARHTLDPLAEGSPEANYIAENGKYLFKHGLPATIALYLVLWVVNLLAVPAFFLFAGGFVADVAWITEYFDVAPQHTGVLQWLLAMAAFAALITILRGLYRDGGPWRVVVPGVGLIGLALTASSLLAVLNRFPWPSDISWWFPRPPVWSTPDDTDGWWRITWTTPATAFHVSLGVAVVLLVMWGAAGRFAKSSIVDLQGLPTVVVGIFRWWIRLIGLVILCVCAGEAYALFNDDFEDPLRGLISLFGVLIGAGLVSWMTARLSLHRVNRSRIASTFATARDATSSTQIRHLHPAETTLSSLMPRPTDAYRYPKLLITATMNIHRYADGTWRRFEPFTFAPDMCGPATARAALSETAFKTTDLERVQRPGGLTRPFGSEPVVRLMTAVACTGAAASPALGKFTGRVPGARTALMLMNIRLGTWLPNPFSARVQADVRNKSRPWRMDRKRRAFGEGFDEFVPELFGLQNSSAARAYLSDGGHYDNLGLLALLRERCTTIWCVDSEADKTGAAGQLRDVKRLAEAELDDVSVRIDLDSFKGVDGRLGTSHAIGEIFYLNAETNERLQGTLIVIKLGLTSDSSETLHTYRSTRDCHFPHHGTFTRVAFGKARMQSYVQLGRENAVRACNDYAKRAVTSPAAESDSTT